MEATRTVVVAPLLWVDDIAESLAFYKRIGFTVRETWEPERSLMWCSMKFDQAEIMLQQRGDEYDKKSQSGGHQEIELYFICDDVDSLYLAFEQEGLRASKPKAAFYSMKQTFLKDPDGRTICFESQIAAK